MARAARSLHARKKRRKVLAQAKGYRGETKDAQSMKNRIRVDMFYVQNWSFLLDVKIILMTINSMIKGDRNAF